MQVPVPVRQIPFFQVFCQMFHIGFAGNQSGDYHHRPVFFGNSVFKFQFRDSVRRKNRCHCPVCQPYSYYRCRETGEHQGYQGFRPAYDTKITAPPGHNPHPDINDAPQIKSGRKIFDQFLQFGLKRRIIFQFPVHIFPAVRYQVIPHMPFTGGIIS